MPLGGAFSAHGCINGHSASKEVLFHRCQLSLFCFPIFTDFFTLAMFYVGSLCFKFAMMSTHIATVGLPLGIERQCLSGPVSNHDEWGFASTKPSPPMAQTTHSDYGDRKKACDSQ